MEVSGNSKRGWHPSATWGLLSLILTFCGAVSYFLLFAGIPALRDFPWVNLPLVVAGVAAGIVSLIRYRRQPKSRLARFMAVGALCLSLGIAALFTWYIFVFSYQLPASDGAVAVGQPAPDFSLSDQNGTEIRLSDFRGQRVVLTFFRGFW